MAYEALIQQATQKYGIPGNLLDSLINQESAKKSRATSPKGAMGLGQLMPATAKELGVTDPYDPAQNIEASARYLKQQLTKFGNPALALAAYNAGPGAVQKYKGIPPFAETQNYVKKIMKAFNPISEAYASEEPYRPSEKELYQQYLAEKQQYLAEKKTKQPERPSEEELYQQYLTEKQQYLAEKNAQNVQEQPTDSWGSKEQDALPSVGKMVKNFIPDIVNNVIPGAVNTIIHPIDTTQGFLNIANSGLQQILPESINNLMPESTRANKNIAPAIGNELRKYVNDPRLISRAIENNPAQALGMLSAVGGIAGKVAGLPKLSSAASAIDPLNAIGGAVAKSSGYIMPRIGRAIGNAIGDFGTHTGGDTIIDAAMAGMQGGDKLKVLKDYINDAPLSGIVENAKKGLAGFAKKSKYENDAAKEVLFTDKTILPYAPIEAAKNKALSIGSYKGHTVSPAAVKIGKEIDAIIEEWSSRPSHVMTQVKNRKHSTNNDTKLKDIVGNQLTNPVLNKKESPPIVNTITGEKIPQYYYSLSHQPVSGSAVNSQIISNKIKHEPLINVATGSPLTEVRFPASDAHTIEGLDALKRRLGEFYKSTESGSPERIVAQNVYHAVKNEIEKQAPEYANLMKKSQADIKLKNQITKELSLNENATDSTALRKLLSIPRKNANTNYGDRAVLAKILEENGADNLISMLNGAALNSYKPRGLGGIVGSGAGGGALVSMLMGNPAAASALTLALMSQSPKLMGKAAINIGKASKKVMNASDKAKSLKLGQQISRANLINQLSGGSQ